MAFTFSYSEDVDALLYLIKTWIMAKKHILLACCLAICALLAKAQSFTEIGATYPLQKNNGKCEVSGFINFTNSTDERIFTNALLWVVKNICPQLQEGIKEISVPAKKFTFEIVIKPDGAKSTYYSNATFRVADGKLIYYISDIEVESTSLVIKRLTPFEKLNPEKKEAHKQMIAEFEKLSSQILNNIFDYVSTYQSSPITHWSDISIHRAVEGMTEDECLLAFGKPQSIMETNGEIQWMYTTSFYLFFKQGVVSTIIK